MKFKKMWSADEPCLSPSIGAKDYEVGETYEFLCRDKGGTEYTFYAKYTQDNFIALNVNTIGYMTDRTVSTYYFAPEAERERTNMYGLSTIIENGELSTSQKNYPCYKISKLEY